LKTALTTCFALLTSLAEAQTAQPERKVLSLSEAVRTALAQQPALRQSQAGTDAAYARADEARAPLLPQVSASAIYSRQTGNFVQRPGQLPSTFASSAGTSFRSFNFFQFGASASQLIWDFGWTLDRWRATQALAAAQLATEDAFRLFTILNVQVSYLNAGARRDLVQVAQETLANQELHLKQIAGFVRVGTRPEIDLAQARTDEANARVQLITAQNNYAISKAQLNQAMGVEGPTDYDVGNDTIAPFPQEDQPLAPLLDVALHTRPEFVSVDQQVRAQELTIASVRGAYFPSLGAGFTFSDVGPRLDSLTWNWTAQATLQWNLFQGLLTNSQMHEARANLIVFQSQRDILRQQVRLEVEQDRLALLGAKEVLSAAEEALTNARIRLRLAERRYQTGVGSVIELSDAQVAATAAAAQEVGARFNLAIARAQLLKAIGNPS
jgi:outer membrane protein